MKSEWSTRGTSSMCPAEPRPMCWIVSGLEKLHCFELLNGSFRPEAQIRELRTYMRLRDNLVVEGTQAIHHMQKALFEMNVQLSNVISDITGESGLRIIDAILAGERDPDNGLLVQHLHQSLTANRCQSSAR